MDTNVSIMFLIIGTITLLLVIGLALDTFNQQKPKQVEQQPEPEPEPEPEQKLEENEPIELPLEKPEEPISLSPERMMYNAVRRQQEQVKADRNDLFNEQKKIGLENENNKLELAKVAIRGELLGLKDSLHELNNRHIETLREALGVEQEKMRVELLRQLLHFDGQKLDFEREKAKEELSRQLFETKMQMQMEKMALETWKMSMTQYFHEQFNTLDTEKIKLLMEQQKSEHQKMVMDLKSIELDIAGKREALNYQFHKLDLESIKIDLQNDALELKKWESDLHVTENSQQIRQNQFEFWEDRVLKQYGFPDFQSYFNAWQRFNELAKKYDFTSIDSFVYKMLPGGQYERMIASYREAQNRYEGLIGRINEEE